MNNKLSELKDAADYWRKVKSGELPAPGPNEISITVCTLDGAVSRISALLAELEREIEMRAQNLEIKTLLAEKVKGLETKLWDSQQLVDAKSSSQIELRSKISSIEESSRKDMAWRGERLCELEDSLEAAEKRIAELEAIRSDASQVFKEIGNELGCNPDNESIMVAIDDLKATQMTGPLKDVLKRNIELEAKLATPVRLPDIRSDDYHETGWFQHMKYYRDVERAISAAGFTVEGDE